MRGGFDFERRGYPQVLAWFGFSSRSTLSASASEPSSWSARRQCPSPPSGGMGIDLPPLAVFWTTSGLAWTSPRFPWSERYGFWTKSGLPWTTSGLDLDYVWTSLDYIWTSPRFPWSEAWTTSGLAWTTLDYALDYVWTSFASPVTNDLEKPDNYEPLYGG